MGLSRVPIDAFEQHGVGDGLFLPGNGRAEWFNDLPGGPEMVVVPAGEFRMGANPDEPDLQSEFAETPIHDVRIGAPFAVGRFAISFEEWDAGAAQGGVEKKPKDHGWGRGKQPAIYISWQDAKAYCAWLSTKTGKRYRLLSEAEWEYACRAGTRTRYCCGDAIDRTQANFCPIDILSEDHSLSDRSIFRTVPVDCFAPNPWGLFQVHGNVWEWVEDTAHWHTYDGAPGDGSVWQGGDRDFRMLRGGSFVESKDWCRAAMRTAESDCEEFRHGFRVARDL